MHNDRICGLALAVGTESEHVFVETCFCATSGQQEIPPVRDKIIFPHSSALDSLSMVSSLSVASALIMDSYIPIPLRYSSLCRNCKTCTDHTCKEPQYFLCTKQKVA
jgi:hypothetical protein